MKRSMASASSVDITERLRTSAELMGLISSARRRAVPGSTIPGLMQTRRMVNNFKTIHRGGIIVLPASLTSSEKRPFDYHDWRFSIGNAFRGKYVDAETGAVFSDRSCTVEIGGLSSKELTSLAERLSSEFNHQTVLVRDFNRQGKFHLVSA